MIKSYNQDSSMAKLLGLLKSSYIKNALYRHIVNIHTN
jgi:hypothetical protein